MMKRLFLALAVGCLFVCAACAPKEMAPWVFPKEKPGAELFRSAQANFKESRYNTAFSFYQQYISRYPDGEMVPQALIQMGVIKGRQEQYDQATAYFKQVMREYVQSPYARQAGVEMLAVLYDAGKFKEEILKAADVFSYDLSREQFVRVSLITGDAYMALDLAQEAYYAFLEAYHRAGRKKTAEEVLPRLNAAVNRLSIDHIRGELERLDGAPPGGYLMYHLGSNYLASGNIGDAIVVFSDFLDQYPGHEMAETAQKRLAELKASGAAEQVNIGCLLPLTGRYEAYGNKALDGIELALSMGAIDSMETTVNLIIADTASDPEQAVRAVEMLNEKRVAVIIGPIAAAQAAAESAQAHNIPIIVFSQASDLPDTGEYVFRNFITPKMQVSRLAAYVSDGIGIDRFAVLYPEEPYGSTFMNLFWDELLACGGSVAGLESYDPSHTDFSDPIKKLVGLYYEVPPDIAEETRIGPTTHQKSPFEAFWGIAENDDSLDSGNWMEDTLIPYFDGLAGEEEYEPKPVVDFRAVFIPDSPEKAGLIIPQLAYYDINDVYLLGTNLWHSDRFIRMAPRHAQGAICPSGFFAASRSKPVRRFVENFEAVYGSKPTFIEAIGFDTAGLLIDLFRRSPYHGRTYIRDQLTIMPPYDGVTGKTRFDETGEAVKALYLLKVRGERFVEVGY